MNLDNFDWGWMDQSDEGRIHKQHITVETFETKMYEKVFEVEPGDIVLDVGASVGSFTYSILDKKPKVYSVPCPDTYAGDFRVAAGYTEEQAADEYVKSVASIIKEMDGNISSFFIESGMGVGGVIMPPKSYMNKAFALVRAAGGVCVCDEVAKWCCVCRRVDQ